MLQDATMDYLPRFHTNMMARSVEAVEGREGGMAKSQRSRYVYRLSQVPVVKVQEAEDVVGLEGCVEEVEVF